ncbi:MAG: ISAs1 family transposase, partial [Chryseobacterium sp.]
PTISRMLSGIDEEIFALTFMEWTAEILNETGIHIIIDGKALCGGTEKIKGGNVPYVLNAIDAATKLVLGQLAIETKTNEITAIPQLLQLLNVKNNVFTIDAIGTQKKIEEQIISNGGHYVLQVKRNNPILYEEIITAFETFEKEQKLEKRDQSREIQNYINQMDHSESMEKNRERIEYRAIDSCTDIFFLSCTKKGNFEHIKTVGRSKQIRVPIEKDSLGNNITVSRELFIKNGSVRKPKIITGDGIKDDIQIVGIISDMIISAKELGDYKRAHWKIENNLHHVLDDDFREDRSTAKKSKNNLSVIRKYAYNILMIYAIKEKKDWGIQRLMDYFSDHPKIIMEYLYKNIESFY